MQPQTKKAAVHRAHTLNVGNLHDTGHLTAPTPPAAMAEQETVGHLNLNFRSWPVVTVELIRHKTASGK